LPPPVLAGGLHGQHPQLCRRKGRIPVSCLRGEKEIGPAPRIRFRTMREIEILAQSFLDEYLAGMQLKRTARTGFSPLQDALCTRDKVVDGGKSRPDPWQFYRFLNTAKNLELAIPASYQPVIRIKCGIPAQLYSLADDF